jgi:hypothetical protein
MLIDDVARRVAGRAVGAAAADGLRAEELLVGGDQVVEEPVLRILRLQAVRVGASGPPSAGRLIFLQKVSGG